VEREISKIHVAQGVVCGWAAEVQLRELKRGFWWRICYQAERLRGERREEHECRYPIAHIDSLSRVLDGYHNAFA